MAVEVPKAELEKPLEPQQTTKPKESHKKNMMDYMLMIWDGLGFFGFDNAKLGRLKGEPVTFASKYKEPTKLTMSVFMIAFVIYIILSQVAKIGKQKD